MEKHPNPDVDKALHAAVAALYFADNSDYETALWQVLHALHPEIYKVMEEEGAEDTAMVYDLTLEWAGGPTE